MSYYVNSPWFIAMCVALILNFASSFLKNKKWVLKIISTTAGFVCLIFWSMTPRYLNVLVFMGYICIMIFACIYLIPVNEESVIADCFLLIVLTIIGGFFAIVFSSVYIVRYKSEHCQIVDLCEPEIIEYTIPEATSLVRFPDGLDYYQLKAKKDPDNQKYQIQFFAEKKYGSQVNHRFIEDVASDVRLLPKEPGEQDYAILYIRKINYIDENTGNIIDTGTLRLYDFYVSQDIVDIYEAENQ